MFQVALNVLKKPPVSCPDGKLQHFPFSYFILTPGYPARSGEEQMHRKQKTSQENICKK